MKDNQKEPLGRLIYLTAQEIKNLAEKHLNPYDLTLEQFHILKQLFRSDGLNQRELGNLVNKTPANITRILDRLAAKHLLVRRPSSEDRRAMLVFLTDKGERMVQKVLRSFSSFSSLLLEGVNKSEQQRTEQVLKQIMQNIKAMTPDNN